MTLPTPADVEPPCSDDSVSGDRTDRSALRPLSSSAHLVARPRSFDTIPPATWDALAARTPWATPFSSWAFHRAWWDGYGASAHEQTLEVVEEGAAEGSDPVAIVPLMHRHEVEPTDAAERTTLRHGVGPELLPVQPTAKAVFFGASYHADYATLLTDPERLRVVADAVVAQLASPPAPGSPHPDPWDVVDLRRLRADDPATEALAGAFEHRMGREGWRVTCEREDVCPVVTIPDDVTDFDGYLATLDKKGRHEIRRKLRRAEAAGEIALEPSPDPLADLDAFIDLHQRRWGDDGLFPPTAGGAASRRFFRRLFELCGAAGTLELFFLRVGDRRIAAGVSFDDGRALSYYNAGVDPDARELSPGVVMVAEHVRLAIARGRRRLDFLRGDEPYKYEWGAVDEPIQRILVERRNGHGRA